MADKNHEDRRLDEAEKKSGWEPRATVRRARQRARREPTGNPDQGELTGGPRNTEESPEPRVHQVEFELTCEQMARFEALTKTLAEEGGAETGPDRAAMLLKGMAALVKRSSSAGDKRNSSHPNGKK